MLETVKLSVTSGAAPTPRLLTTTPGPEADQMPPQDGKWSAGSHSKPISRHPLAVAAPLLAAQRFWRPSDLPQDCPRNDNSLDLPDRDGAGESTGSVLAQATCSFAAGGYPRKTLQVSPRANTVKF